MRYILVTLLLIVSITIAPKRAWSYFGFAVIESPAQSIESIVDDILRDSNMQESMKDQPLDVENLRKALIKGALENKDVMQALLVMRNETLPAIPPMPLEAHEKEYFFAQVSLRATAQDYGYKEELK